MPSTDLFERDWYPNHEGACAAQVLRFGSVAEAEVCPSARLRRVRAVGPSHAAELRHFYRDPVYAPSTRMRKSMPPALVELRQPTSQRPFMHSVSLAPCYYRVINGSLHLSDEVPTGIPQCFNLP